MTSPQSESIDPSFRYESRYVVVRGSYMHYYEVGEGEPILFLHGNPTWGYLWRNVVPHVAAHGRCVVPDLIGMGYSDKPDLAYRFFDHYAYLVGFIEALGLTRMTLVVHDWGSALGLHYWDQRPRNVRALALMEAILPPLRWTQFPVEFRLGFRVMRTPGVGWFVVSVCNAFVEQVLPRAVVRELSASEMAHYRAPFPTVASRRPVRQWPREIPLEGHPVDVADVVARYRERLERSSIPKLLLYARPGGIVRDDALSWCRHRLPALETADVGPGIHFLQEDRPRAIGDALAHWYARLPR